MTRIAVLVLLLSSCLVAPARSADIVIDGEAGCTAIGGEWTAPVTCAVHHLVVQAGTTLVFAAGVGLVSDGPAFNYGVVETHDYFRSDGPFYNRGSLLTYGLTVNENLLSNERTFLNYGWLHLHGLIANYGWFENEGTLETCAGPFVNYGYMRNGNAIENWGTLIVNHGIAVNEGYIYNPDSDWYRIPNYGGFENSGVVDNDGSMPVGCGGAWYGDGHYGGNPVEYEPCDPAVAIGVLNAYISGLGAQGSGILTKAQIISLTSKTARAGKRPGEAAALIEAFVEEVGGLVADGSMPSYIGVSLVGRVDRIAVLLAGGA